ncbi:MAG: glycosyltransferase family 4 protein [Thermoplasmatales archaeon]|nr:glycosyltransferase family 4 protein [Thermoplasmatales archaeon]
MRLRIVDVNPYFYPFLGGIEHRMHDTSKLLAERGHEVTVLTGRLEGTAEEEKTQDGYRIVRLPSRQLSLYNPPFISSKGVLEALESLDADVVNFNYRWAPSYSRDLARYDGPKVFTYHNLWGEGIGLQAVLSGMNDRRFGRKYLPGFDHVIAVSDFVRDDLIARGYDPDWVTTIPNCLRGFPEVGAEEGDFILSLGRLVRTKGLDYLIDAMVDVDAKLIICGKGPDGDRLARRIRKRGVGDRVEMRGWVSEEEKNRLMSTCKFFVMPSIFESLGLAAVELMSYGRPVVCSNVSGLPHTVGEGGIAVDPKDPEALSGAMNALLSDAGLRRELGAKARAQAERYDWGLHIGRLEEILENAATGRQF